MENHKEKYYPPTESGRKDGRTCRLSRGRLTIPWCWLDDLGISIYHKKHIRVIPTLDDARVLTIEFFQNGTDGLSLEIANNYGALSSRVNVSSVLAEKSINASMTNAYCGTRWNEAEGALKVFLPIENEDLYRPWVPKQVKYEFPVEPSINEIMKEKKLVI